MTDIMLWATFASIVLAIAAILHRWVNAKRRTRTAPPQGNAIRYTNHAKERMTERGVTVDQVESVLAAPARATKDPENNSVRLEGDIDGDILKVWVAEPWPARGEIVIKTTAWKHILEFEIPSAAVRHVIGREGKTIRSIEQRTGARVSISHGSTIRISAGDRDSTERAREAVNSIVERPVRRSA